LLLGGGRRHYVEGVDKGTVVLRVIEREGYLGALLTEEDRES
jgi:hypothetical protein